MKKDKIYLKHNSLADDIPVVIFMKAMGIQSDREIAQLVCGNDHDLHEAFSINVEEASRLRVFTQLQALDYIGAKVKINKKLSTVRRTLVSTIFGGIRKLWYLIRNRRKKHLRC